MSRDPKSIADASTTAAARAALSIGGVLFTANPDFNGLSPPGVQYLHAGAVDVPKGLPVIADHAAVAHVVGQLASLRGMVEVLSKSLRHAEARVEELEAAAEVGANDAAPEIAETRPDLPIDAIRLLLYDLRGILGDGYISDETATQAWGLIRGDWTGAP